MPEDKAIVSAADEFGAAIFEQPAGQSIHRSGVRRGTGSDFKLHAEVAHSPAFDGFVTAGCPDLVAHGDDAVDGSGVRRERPNKFTTCLPNAQMTISTARDPRFLFLEVMRAVQAAFVMGNRGRGEAG